MGNNYGINSGKALNENEVINWVGLLVGSNNSLRCSMGEFGGAVRAAGTYNGNFCCIKALEDSVVTASGNINGLTAVTILGGDNVPGTFSQVIVVSGKVILYDVGD